MTAVVTPENVLRELTELWTGLNGSEEQGVLRACAMTLILAADEEEDAAEMAETIGELMHSHPCRAIVLRIRDGQHAFLESRVLAQCWRPLGRTQQICSEQIEIKASEGSLPDLPRLVHGLMAPDLPVVLVCRNEELFLRPAFAPMLRIPGRIIVDANLAADPRRLLDRVASLLASGRNVSDLAWGAITKWREHIADQFEADVHRRLLPQVTAVRIGHAGARPPIAAIYLAAWLVSIRGPQLKVEFVSAPETRRIQWVELLGAEAPLRLTCSHTAVGRALTLSTATACDLLHRELSLSGRDAAYERALPVAIGLAGAS